MSRDAGQRVQSIGVDLFRGSADPTVVADWLSDTRGKAAAEASATLA